MPSQSGELIEADLVVERLRHAIGEGSAGLNHVPGLLKRTLKEESWRERVISRTGERVEFASFVEFVKTPPLEGLGGDIQIIKNLVRDDDEARSLLDAALYNVQPSETGNAAARALRRLRDQRPDLHEQVLAGELSAHRAMVQAGFRRPTATVYVDTPRAAVEGLLRRFTKEQLGEALSGL